MERAVLTTKSLSPQQTAEVRCARQDWHSILHHPAADLLMNYATVGRPTKTGKNWSINELEEAIEVAPHVSALNPEAMEQLQLEVKEKETLG